MDVLQSRLDALIGLEFGGQRIKRPSTGRAIIEQRQRWRLRLKARLVVGVPTAVKRDMKFYRKLQNYTDVLTYRPPPNFAAVKLFSVTREYPKRQEVERIAREKAERERKAREEAARLEEIRIAREKAERER